MFATYSITEDRKKLISFAGPYYGSQQSILVLADNDDIASVDDLAGKNVAAQSGSTGPSIMEEVCPDAKLQEFKTDEEARSALAQGRVDAYVIDRNMLFSDMMKQPGKYKMAGEPFGPEDLYGIGLPLDSDGVAFVNAFLTKVERTVPGRSCGSSVSAIVPRSTRSRSLRRSARRLARCAWRCSHRWWATPITRMCGGARACLHAMRDGWVGASAAL